MKSAIIFDTAHTFANLSRVDPALISTGMHGRAYLHPVGNGSYPIVFTSVIVVNECHLMKPKISGNSQPFKMIGGKVFSGEWERMIGCIGMILGVRDFKAQLYKDVLSFATSYQPPNETSTSSYLTLIHSYLIM
jgi:hypothetical protein